MSNRISKYMDGDYTNEVVNIKRLCSRCGRDTHFVSNCNYRIHKDGHELYKKIEYVQEYYSV